MKNRFRKALFVYSLICDIPVSFCLCMASAITAQSNLTSGILTVNFNTIDWLNMLTNFVIALILSLIISNFIPLTAIGRWFTGLFKVPNVTYTGNMKYRLLSTLIISLIFFIGISPILTIINCFLLPVITGTPKWSLDQAWLSFILNAPIMILVGFISSLLNDMIAYKAAHRIDESF